MNIKGLLFAAAISAAQYLGLSASADAVEISYSPWLPSGFIVNDVMNPWFAKVEEVTEGRVKVVPRAAGVGTAADQFDVVHDGVVDMSLVVPSYRAGRFPLMELGELGLTSENPAVLAPAFYRIYESALAEHAPFPDVHVISVWSFSASGILTRSKPVSTATDLTGLKVYTAQKAISDAMVNLGATPIQKSVQETYSMSSTGVIDAVMMPFDPSVSWNLHDIYKAFTVIPGGFGQSVMALVVNQDTWSRISEEDRAAIMAISGETMATEMGRVLCDAEYAASEKLRSQGVQIAELPESEIAAFREAFAPVEANWIAKAEAVGLRDASALLHTYREELAGLGADKRCYNMTK